MQQVRELAPVSDAVTDGFRVEVVCKYSEENSSPHEGKWVFQYTVRITNLGAETARLVSRHWIITDGTMEEPSQTREVKGPGVVGEQPLISAGETYQYSSWSPLTMPYGTMHGTYQMVSASGRQFEIEIAPFGLKARYVVN